MAKEKEKVKYKYRTKPAERKTSRKKVKKTLLSKSKKFALPAAAGLAFLSPYMKRSHETGMGIPDLLKADFENFNTEDAVERTKAAVPKVAGLAVGGIVIKEAHLLGKYSGLASEVALGLGLGTLAKAVIDPPGVPEGYAGAPGRTASNATRINMYA